MEFVRLVWNCLSKLCLCMHCTDDLGSQVYEPNERTHLLVDPVDSSPALRCVNSDNLSSEFSQSFPKKDEQNALSRLVQNTAVNMIDVGAMDSHNLENQEYNDRIKLYWHRLQQQWTNVQHPRSKAVGLLKDVSNPEDLLVAMVLKSEDLVQMKNVLSKVQIALNDFKIEHMEAIVVPFCIP